MSTGKGSEFGSLLRRYRLAAGLTQEELAERANLSVQGISNLERGVRRLPYKHTLQQLADALALSDEERSSFVTASNAEDRRHGVGEPLAAGRDAVRSRHWQEAYALLSTADSSGKTEAEDLQSLGEAAWATGHYGEAVRAWERAHASYVSAGKRRSAALMAVTLAIAYVLRLELTVALGWHSAADRLLEGEDECLAHGFVEWFRAQAGIVLTGDIEGALRHSQTTAAIGRRLNNPDMQMLGLATEARALVKQGRVEEGTKLLDETMAIALSGQIDPWTSGLIYCNTLSACQDLADYRRAAEWTEAARRNRAGEGIVPAVGHCRIHRAAILRLSGLWDEAEEEARYGCDECRGGDLMHIGMAMYEIGEIRLRKGDLVAAEEAFRQAHELGRSPFPGMALLRLAQGNVDAALASITNALSDDIWDQLARAGLLAAQIEICLVAQDLAGARRATAELRDIARGFRTPTLEAAMASAQGAILLAEGESVDALMLLRRACRLWQRVGVPYEIAKVRLLLAQAFAARGDGHSAELEAVAARSTFERLGATPDARRAAAFL